MSNKDIQIGGNHYKDMKIQPIDYIVENEIPYRKQILLSMFLGTKPKTV